MTKRDWGLGIRDSGFGIGRSAHDGSNPETTTTQYTFFPLGGVVNGPTVATQTTVLPVVSTAQHGSGAAKTSTDVFDTFGETVWSMDAAGYITYTQYDPGLIPNCP